MRKKVVAGCNLVVLAVATMILMSQLVTPSEPPVWVGMSHDEVTQALGQGGPIQDHPRCPYEGASWYVQCFCPEPDWFGNRRFFGIAFSHNGFVTQIQVHDLPRARPPWLDRALKAVGR
jgi:hypothetical protein